MAPNKPSTTTAHATELQKTTHEQLFEETLNIVRHVVYSSRDTATPQARRFHELVKEIIREHDVFGCICSNLRVSPSNMREIFQGIVETMFEDGVLNWGRLVALVAFSVKLAEYLHGEYNGAVAQLTTDAIIRKAGQWIVARGGWVNVVTHFPEKQGKIPFTLRNESWIKGILVTATATIGIGALFAVTCIHADKYMA